MSNKFKNFYKKHIDKIVILLVLLLIMKSCGKSGTDCYLWTSSLNLDLPRLVYYLTFYSNIIGIYSTDRYDGFTIRPVINL